MKTTRLLSPSSSQRDLLVMLPAAHARPDDFVDQGFVKALWDVAPFVDVELPAATNELYIGGEVVDWLTRVVVDPAVLQGYRNIWVVGISLGGSGALRLAQAVPQSIRGLVLLAPFVVTRGAVAAVARAGGLPNWTPGAVDVDEANLLNWLKDRASDPHAVPIYLGYGTEDRFAPASHLLADQIANDRVVALPGDHDWPTWMQLWKVLLARIPFAPASPPDAYMANPHG